MNKEEKEEFRKQVEEFLESSEGLNKYQIDCFPYFAQSINAEKFEQLLDEWSTDKNSVIKKDTKEDKYIHEKNINKPSETEYYTTVINWLQKGLKIESEKFDHTKALKEKKGINHWRYPDIIGIRKRNYLENGILKIADLTGQKYYPEIWSFEVKIDLLKGNMRNYFFQCLSNSGWANRRYVVVVTDLKQRTKIEDEVIAEFRKLSLRYHVGLIQITSMNTTLSEEGSSSILVDCPRQDLDLEIMNDLCISLPEFKDWLESLEEVQ